MLQRMYGLIETNNVEGTHRHVLLIKMSEEEKKRWVTFMLECTMNRQQSFYKSFYFTFLKQHFFVTKYKFKQFYSICEDLVSL